MDSNEKNKDTNGCEDGVCIPLKKSAEAHSNPGETNLSASYSMTTSDQEEEPNVKIDIISDTMCPWCWVGKRNLEAALKDMPNVRPKITWLPYFLDKHLPEEGKPVREYYLGNYGDPNAGERMKPGLINAGKRCGIDFETNYIKLSHYRPTMRSHRLIHLAKKQNKQDGMVEELFHMYYEKGNHLNSIEHLVESANKVGLTGDINGYLQSDEDEKDVYEEAESVKYLAHGVPTFIFTKPGTTLSHSFSGGQPPSAFKEVFDVLTKDNDDD